ncbi:MAG: protoporphyrinogen oxidase [Planctomycetota bacterium]|nr:protoporphyrinogen oxidase [Planctomycetota bacterium]
MIEGGADSFITNKPWGVDLCRELGLGDALIGTDSTRRRSFVVRNGRLLPVPEGFVMMSPSRIGSILTSPILSLRGKLRLLLERFVPRKTDDSDESLASFVKRRLGREALDRLVQPLVGGIYTADPNDLSIAATLPQFLAMEREYGSLIRAARHQKRADQAASGARYGLFVSLADGMEALPKALSEALPSGTIRTETPVRRISRPDPLGPWRIELLDGSSIEASAVLITTEAHAAARLVDGFDPELALQLRSIPYASSAIVSVAYRRNAIAHPLDGFGAVVPIIEKRSILAISFTSVKFPNRAPADSVLLRVFVGGATQAELFDLDDSAMATIVRRELGELIGATGEPLFLEIRRHPRGMPQYNLGHLDRVAAIRRLESQHEGLGLAGNAFDGVGIPDCIRSGRSAADAILSALTEAGRRAVA